MSSHVLRGGVEFSYRTVGTTGTEKVVCMEWFADRARALEAVGRKE